MINSLIRLEYKMYYLWNPVFNSYNIFYQKLTSKLYKDTIIIILCRYEHFFDHLVYNIFMVHVYFKLGYVEMLLFFLTVNNLKSKLNIIYKVYINRVTQYVFSCLVI